MIYHNGFTQFLIPKRAYRPRLYYNIFLKFEGSVLAYLVLSEEEVEELE
jgi:hypothetical protein